MLAAIGLAGCQSSPAATPTAVPVTPTAVLTAVPPETTAETAQPVEAAAKGTPDNPLIQLLVPSGKVDQILAGVHELDDLMEAQGVALNSSIAVSYAAAIDALCSGQADIVWMAPLSYVVAKDKCPESQLLFTSLRFGSKAYNGQILVGADSGIDKLEDLAGKTIAFSGSGQRLRLSLPGRFAGGTWHRARSASLPARIRRQRWPSFAAKRTRQQPSPISATNSSRKFPRSSERPTCWHRRGYPQRYHHRQLERIAGKCRLVQEGPSGCDIQQSR